MASDKAALGIRDHRSQDDGVRHVAGFAVVFGQLRLARITTGQHLTVVEQKHQALLGARPIGREINHTALRNAHQFHTAAVGGIPQP